jgi:hypothetical protein
MQSIYKCISWKTLRFLGIWCCSYSAVIILVMLFPIMNLSYIYINTLRSMCAVSNMGVFCSYFISCFPSTLPMYFLNYFQIVPVAPIITRIIFICTFTMPSISIVILESSWLPPWSDFCLLKLQYLLTHTRSAIFWVITQHRVVIPYWHGGKSIDPIFRVKKFFLGSLTLEDGTNRLYWNVGMELPLYALSLWKNSKGTM